MESHRVGHDWSNLACMHACIGGGDGNTLQCSCLETSRDRGAWWAAVYGVVQSRTWLKQLSSSSSSITTKIPSSLDCLVWRKQMNIRQNSKVVQNPLEWGAGINGMDSLVPSGIHYLSSLCSRQQSSHHSEESLALWLRQKRICLQCWRPWFSLWVWKIPWRREWGLTPVFLSE